MTRDSVGRSNGLLISDYRSYCPLLSKAYLPVALFCPGLAHEIRLANRSSSLPFTPRFLTHPSLIR